MLKLKEEKDILCKYKAKNAGVATIISDKPDLKQHVL